MRVGLSGSEKNRGKIIAAGAIIIRTIMETLGMSQVLVSDLGLREGVLIELAKRIIERETSGVDSINLRPNNPPSV